MPSLAVEFTMESPMPVSGFKKASAVHRIHAVAGSEQGGMGGEINTNPFFHGSVVTPLHPCGEPDPHRGRSGRSRILPKRMPVEIAGI